MKYNSIGEQLIAKAKELDPSYKPDKFNDMSEALDIILNNTGGVDEEDVLNIIESNSEQVSELSIGTSVSFNGKDDEQIPTSKAVIQKIDNKLTRNNLISAVGEATESLSGIMSAEDKKNLNTLVALLQDDENNIVDTIKEVLAIFEQYPEGADLVSTLGGKADKADTYNKTEVDNKFSNYYNKSETEAMIDQKINVSINDILSEEY